MASDKIYIKPPLDIPHELEADIVHIATADHNYSGINNMCNQTCMKRSPLRQRKRGLIRQLYNDQKIKGQAT
jgi:hypothetical protein